MNRTFNYDFEELPLVVVPGIEAALINGRAEIAYSRDGYWEINSVAVEGHKRITQAERDKGIKPWVYIPATPALEALIFNRLQGEWASKVGDAVSEQIAIDREEAAEFNAEVRRDRMMERSL